MANEPRSGNRVSKTRATKPTRRGTVPLGCFNWPRSARDRRTGVRWDRKKTTTTDVMFTTIGTLVARVTARATRTRTCE